MPANTYEHWQKLSQYNTKLDALFNEVDFTDIPELQLRRKEMQQHVKEIQEYYAKSLSKSEKIKTAENILKTYETYIDLAEKLKTQRLGYNKELKNFPATFTTRETYKEQKAHFNEVNMKFQTASATVKSAIHDRRAAVLFHDLFKFLELIFWASAGVSLYASLFLIALPMLLVQPPLGIAVMITVGGLLLGTAIKCIETLRAFKTISRHDNEYNHETAVLRFFKPVPPEEPKTVQAPKAEETPTPNAEETSPSI
jgi:hypothetical protein